MQLLPNLVTLVGLCAGLTALRLAYAGQFEPAAALLVFAAAIDGLDGLLARKLNAASSFGAELELALGLRQLRGGAGAARLPGRAGRRPGRELDGGA